MNGIAGTDSCPGDTAKADSSLNGIAGTDSCPGDAVEADNFLSTLSGGTNSPGADNSPAESPPRGEP